MAVYKRKNTWYIDYYINVNGKRERRREPVSTRRDVAENRLKEYREMIKNGKDPLKDKSKNSSFDSVEEIQDVSVMNVPQELTLEQFIPTFLELHGKLLSEKMQQSYKTSLFVHLYSLELRLQF